MELALRIHKYGAPQTLEIRSSMPLEISSAIALPPCLTAVATCLAESRIEKSLQEGMATRVERTSKHQNVEEAARHT